MSLAMLTSILPNCLVDLNDIAGATVGDGFGVGGTVAEASRDGSTDYLRDPNAFDAVGKTSFGDIEIIGDTLYVVELSQKRLYAIDLTASTPLTVDDIQYFDIPNPNSGLTGGRENDIRPFGLGINDGKLYVGMVDSAENGTAANLKAHVYTFDPTSGTNGAFETNSVAEFDLDYDRGYANDPFTGSDTKADWQPWTDSFATATADPGQKVHAQPILSDIEFDNGSMILGFRDRLGDQIGQNTPDPNGSGSFSTRTAGDILRAAPDTANQGQFVLESNGSVADGFGSTLNSSGNDTSNPQPSGTSTKQGPDGREFYTGDAYSDYHGEIGNGSLVQLPGLDQVMTTVFDPIYSGGGSTFDGGVRRLNNVDGSFNTSSTEDRYRVFNGNGVTAGSASNFGKQNGLGDIEALLENAPIEIGNRIWLDTNSDGIQDAGETGTDLTGITVSLYDMSDPSNPIKVGETTSSAAGEYNFNDGNVNLGSATGIEPNSRYEIRLDNTADFATGGKLNGYKLTGSSQGNKDEIDSDAVDNSEPTISLTTGDYGANDYSQDFGFTQTGEVFSLGNRVWEDTDNNGLINGAESGINDVTVDLYVDGNNDNVPDGAAIASTTTANGGYYRFDDLVAGNYIVEVNADNFETGNTLEGFVSSGTDEVDPDNSNDVNVTDLNDNGIGIIPDATNGIRSNAVTLGPGFSEPVGETDLDPTFPTETVLTSVETPGLGNPAETPNTITYDGISPVIASGNNIRFQGDRAVAYRFKVDATGYGNDLLAFCIEFAEPAATGNFTPANAAGAAPYFNSSYQDSDTLPNFFDNDPNTTDDDNYGIITQAELNIISTVWANVEDNLISDPNAAQALQILIWESQNDQTFDLSTGNFALDATASSNATVRADTQAVIDTVTDWRTKATDGTWTGSLNLAILTIEDKQDLIVNLDLEVGANDNQSNLTVDFGFDGPERDFGDAPDADAGTETGDYKTRLADGGPSHIIDNKLLIGTSIDFEDGISENAAADADGADEDGFSEPSDSSKNR